MSDLYETLGVERTADTGEITKAYRAKARKHHPDRPGGDAESFKLIALAFEVLADEESRKRYDQTGDIPGAKPASLVEREVAAMVVEAFLQDKQPPIRWMCEMMNQSRGNCVQAAAKHTANRDKLKRRLAEFVKANAKTKNKAANALITEAMESQIGELQRAVDKANEGVKHYTAVLTFLNDLQSGDLGSMWARDVMATGFGPTVTFGWKQ